MSKYLNKSKWFVYHYEYTNDNRRILIFEPNIFEDEFKAHIHADVLHYLSSQQFYYCKEGDISKLDLILDNDSVVTLPFPFVDIDSLAKL